MRAISEHSSAERNTSLAARAFDRLLGLISGAAIPMCGESGKSFQSIVEQLRAQWAEKADPALTEATVEGVVWTVERFISMIKADCAGRERELTNLLRLMAEAGTAIVSNGTTQHERLCSISTQIEAVREMNDIGEIRRNLSRQVTELAQVAKQAQEQALHHSQRLESELRATTERLKVAESLAGLDDLTGIGNRRTAETVMEKFLENGTPFSVILFDLDNFKPINDTHGHLCGDQLLRAVGKQLKSFLRSNDLVCRIGGDEFLAVLPRMNLARAMAKAKEIQTEAFGEFLVTVDGRDTRVSMHSSVGASEAAQRDRSTEILARADAALYRDKASRQKSGSARKA